MRDRARTPILDAVRAQRGDGHNPYASAPPAIVTRAEHNVALLRLLRLRAVLDSALAYSQRPREDAGTRIPPQWRKGDTP